MLLWHNELWLIDHGAALYFHHSWHNWQEQSTRPFANVKDHVLLPRATELDAVDTAFKAVLTSQVIREIVNLIPDIWVKEGFENATPHEVREVYFQFLTSRISASIIFVKEAQYARESLI